MAAVPTTAAKAWLASVWAVHIDCESHCVEAAKAMISVAICSPTFNALNIPLQLIDVLE